ncbi:glycosyltransferase family 2 protein [Algoriphagus hitonicola]|uniref:Glycosyltransferase, GT2 family n=1 Tax=Algoriphagus hitonicola TaxID=435880 RepID=A0A1I2XRD5_9BACT|nr:glycosyltransferase family 2 protein [Algoriphagus hitonicola]SFH16068.1 Glycosyltransferase, GT2 family [Algoriphagus hitonicola]
MSFNPLRIGVIVPTYNRPIDIKKFVDEIIKQSYSNFQVYIIDDCGDFEINNLIPDQYFYERLDRNLGQASARNYGVSLCDSDILVFMDDDAWFLEKDALEKVVDYFNSDLSLGGLMFDINEPNRKWLHERHHLIDNQEIGEFIACGCAFRRSEFIKTSGFRDEFHSYGEETDLAMQLIKNGSKIKFGKKIKVFHNYNPGERSPQWLNRFKFNSVRNDLFIVLTRYPFIYVFPYFIGKTISHILFSVKYDKNLISSFFQIIKGVFSSILIFEFKKRSPLSISQFNYWLKVRF